MEWLDYREKLKIGFNDEEKLKYFFVKIFNFLCTVTDEASHEYGENEYFEFCDAAGALKQSVGFRGEFSAVVNELYKHQKSLEEFLFYYIAFVQSVSTNENCRFPRYMFINAIQNMLNQSHIPFELFKDEDGYYIFPKGAHEMDDALVSEPLEWLSAYPKARTAFAKALREYADQTEDNASDIADKFRKSLETFMQEFFDTDKTLENCKSIYGGYLKEQGVPKELSGNLETLLNSYATFMNGYAKHHDKTSVNILEYIMYQTGNIIRLLITLKNREKDED